MAISRARLPRSSGILLHPTSFPGPFGIGDLGPAAYRWVEKLASARQLWWQILPLGPTGAGDSPYQSFSAFAGSIMLLSPELLENEGLVRSSFWQGQSFSDGPIDHARVAEFKTQLLQTCWESFRAGQSSHLREPFESYCHQHDSVWLHDYALFMTLRELQNGAGLSSWRDEWIRREPGALKQIQDQHSLAIQRHKFGQFLFEKQWSAIKRYAQEKHVQLIGDIPIFVSGDSADVWANRHQFLVNDRCQPHVVAGVPPDYFAEDGQHWGNPIYDWAAMEKDGYRWWTARVRHALAQVDWIRLDHFRGFVQAWHIPAGEKTARNGKWVDGAGQKLFDAMFQAIGPLPFIAEDLGYITPDVYELRDNLQLPGMRVLQFMIGGPDNPHLPHQHEINSVVYTGTHDNDTTRGWYNQLTENEKAFLTEYSGHEFQDPAWDLLRMTWASVSRLALAPLQDILNLGTETRMNRPGIADGNWRWRVREDQLRKEPFEKLAEWTYRYARTI